MQVTAYKTKKICVGDDLYQVLNDTLPSLSERDVIVVSAKIVSICEENVVKMDGPVTKEQLIMQEAGRFIKDERFYHEKKTILTVKNSILIPSSGIDESNGNGYYVLWPKDVMQSANEIWQYLRKQHKLKDLGVILTDSCFMPLRRGAVGIGVAWCGFEPIADYRKTSDIFGRNLPFTTSSHIDGLSAAAEVVMGEGNQQTPLAIIRDIPFVVFQDCPPSKEEIRFMKITLEDDYFAPLLTAAKWKNGGSK